MSDIIRTLIHKEKRVEEGVEYYYLEFFDHMDGKVLRVMAPLADTISWVGKKAAPAVAEEPEVTQSINEVVQ